jgi:RNA polymerase sigma-70 factor (ECF subfamily)
MDPDIDLQSLMARYQQGDSDAASALVYHLSPQLHRFFLVKVVSRRHADDLLQETWMRIHQVRHTYRRGQPVLPWLYAIARNIRVDHYRKAFRTESHEQPLEPGYDIREVSPERPAPTADLEALLAELPESQREVIAMLKVSGMSLEEVAHATKSSIGSVKQKAHRAYDKLRQGLAGMGRPNVRGRGLS